MTKRQIAATLAALLTCVTLGELGSETYKMVTYYPAPYGSYRKFQTTGDTWLAKNTGNLIIGDTNPGLKVGIGVAAPVEKLEINGAVVVSGTNNNKPGSIKYDSGTFWGCCDTSRTGNVNGWYKLEMSQSELKTFITNNAPAPAPAPKPQTLVTYNSPNATCPSGATTISKFWGSAATCSPACGPRQLYNCCYSNNSTSPQWAPTAPSMPCNDNHGTISGTCTANSWSAVQCLQ